MMLEILASLPPKWWWSLEKPLPSNQGRKGRKTFAYSVYMANGEIIGTKAFASVWQDGDDLPETIRKAVVELGEKIKAKEDDVK